MPRNLTSEFQETNCLVIRLKELLLRLRTTQSALAKHLKISKGTLSVICNYDYWPGGPKTNQALLIPKIEDFLRAHGATKKEIAHAFERVNEGRKQKRCNAAVPPDSPGQQALDKQEELLMLLRRQRLTQEARQHFRILRDPFVNEMTGTDDVFNSPDIRQVRAAVRQTAQHGGMLAVTGESGSGKSTIRKDLQAWIGTSNEQIVMIEPYVVGMSASSKGGRPLLAGDIVSAVIRNLAPSASPKVTHERRTEQMHQLLRESAKVGNKHVLIIEEAHDLAIPTLKSMKRFYELEDGFKKLLAIILVGHPELAHKLSEKNPEVREVVQRCELVTLPPLDNHVGEYLTHKFKRMGMDVGSVLEPDAIDAVRAVLRRNVASVLGGKRIASEQSLCYPLAVNNLVTRAMNQAVQIGAPKVNAELVNAALQGDSHA